MTLQEKNFTTPKTDKGMIYSGGQEELILQENKKKRRNPNLINTHLGKEEAQMLNNYKEILNFNL